MYRGVFVNALSIGPISAFQYGCNGVLSILHRRFMSSLAPTALSSSPAAEGAPVQRQTTAEGLVIAATTGALSSLVVCPAELLMISQQRSGQSFAQVVADLWKGGGGAAQQPLSVVARAATAAEVGIVASDPAAASRGGGGGLVSNGSGGGFASVIKRLNRGLTATCIREAGWTFGFLGLAPMIRKVKSCQFALEFGYVLSVCWKDSLACRASESMMCWSHDHDS